MRRPGADVQMLRHVALARGRVGCRAAVGRCRRGRRTVAPFNRRAPRPAGMEALLVVTLS